MKLSPRFYGPFQVLKKMVLVAYRLDLPSESKIHTVFHVSCLKEKLGQRHQLVVTLPPTNKEGIVRPEPEEILRRKMTQKKGKAVIDVLVKWRGLAEEEASWVAYADLTKEFPDLVGKVI